MISQTSGKSGISLRIVGRRPRGWDALLAAIEGLEPRLFLSAVKPVAAPKVVAPKPAAVHVVAPKAAAPKAVAPKVAAVVAPASLSATAAGTTSVQIVWSVVPSATGYNVLKAVTGNKFTVIGKVSASSPSFSDTAVLSNHSYSYEVQAYSATATAPVSKAVAVTTPMASPTKLIAAAQSAAAQPAAVQLKWTDNDSSATGYLVLRSTDATHFSQLAKLTTGTASTYTDATVSDGHVYDYEIQAFNKTNSSAPSAMAAAMVAINAPAGLTAVSAGANVNLAWTDKDVSAAGYIVLRSTDGTNFTQVGQLTSASAASFADTALAAGQKYYYEIKAVNGSVTSAASNIATVTLAAPSGPGSVTITTRYGDELVVTAAGTSDSVAVTQSGSTLTITADGQTTTDPVPAAGVFVYTRGGADTISIGSSVAVRTTLDSIDNSPTFITSAGSNVSAWMDSTDVFSGTGTVHSVASFAGNVSKAVGASLPNPSDAGPTAPADGSLWGAGPVADDVNQGGVGDCFFLSTLAAFAGTSPARLNESAVDLGDGTYAVQYYSQNKPVYVRVSNSFSTGWFDGFAYAHPGSNNTIWAMVMEKAFAYFRTGANTMASLNGGWMGEAYTALGVANTEFTPGSFNQTSFYATVSADLAAGKPITLAALNAPNVVNDHAYTLVSASVDSTGTAHYVIRNPWGSSGDSLEDSNGYATLTFAQLVANFAAGCVAA